MGVAFYCRRRRSGFGECSGGTERPSHGPEDHGTYGDLHGTACAMEPQPDSSTQSSHPEVYGAAEEKGGDGHIDDYEKVLQRLESTRLIFSGEKSAFGLSEIMVIGHLRGPYGRKLSPAKVEAISVMKEDCNSVTEVQRFLGACAFYHIWIPHYAHIA